MRLLIDTHDGLGMQDYTPAVRVSAPLTIHREHGEWTVCHAGLDVTGIGLSAPQSQAHVRVEDGNGNALFDGYTESSLIATSTGATASGLDECLVLRAVEGGWLTQAGVTMGLQPAGARQHPVALCNVALHMQPVRSPGPAHAADVTLSGEIEATKYVTELFRGDGTTQSFTLQHAPFREHSSDVLLDELFDGDAINSAVWLRTDAGGYLGLGGGGLRLNGGTGADGATVLQYQSPVEAGGALTVEVSGLLLNAGSDGVLAGLYDTTVSHSQCVAGVRVRGAGGAYSLVALVDGVEQATAYSLAAGHTYTLRVCVHCVEQQRVRTVYSALVDGAMQQFGGGTVAAPLSVMIQVVDTGLASSTAPTVLYDGAVAVSPSTLVFAPVNSVALTGSVGRVRVTQAGPCRIATVSAGGSTRTRRQGAPAAGGDYVLSSEGVITFAAGLVPQPGDLIVAQHRLGQQAIARKTDASALYQATALGLPGVPAWTGRVAEPAARSSADCAAAASALLALRAGTATGFTGEVTWVRGGATSDDVLPGDTLLLRTAEGTQVVPVAAVTLTDGNCAPERVEYRATMRQDAATNLDFRVEASVAGAAPLPLVPAVEAVLPAALQGLQVTVAGTTALQLDAGIDAPAGYGFEVRRSDATFGAASVDDLVLRSPVRSFSVPRTAFAERFFVRMYDTASPPNYSAVSSVVFTNLPVS